MKLVTKILITVGLAIVASALFGCHKSAPDYGLYNLGVCGVPDKSFMASSVDVEADHFNILADADGPTLVNDHSSDPIILKFAGEQGGIRRYTSTINGHEDEIDVRVQGGVLVGQFLAKGHLEARLHGQKGTVATLGADGRREFEYCQAH